MLEREGKQLRLVHTYDASMNARHVHKHEHKKKYV